jgi:hypothetical protein
VVSVVARQLLLENFFELATQWRVPDEAKRKRFLDVALAPPSRSSDCRGMNPNGQPPPPAAARKSLPRIPATPSDSSSETSRCHNPHIASVSSLRSVSLCEHK